MSGRCGRFGCTSPVRPGGRYCLGCHAEWMRENRPPFRDLKPHQKRKALARSLVRRRIERGSMLRKPCRECGAEPAEAHHRDYSRPYLVDWLCRPCHLDHHEDLREMGA